jgi:hypothetical protein
MPARYQTAVILEDELPKIDKSLFLYKTTNGQCIFPVFDPSSGLPTVTEVVGIVRKGAGEFPWKNGFPLPDKQMIDQSGWGMKAICFVPTIDDQVGFIGNVIKQAKELLAACENQNINGVCV